MPSEVIKFYKRFLSDNLDQRSFASNREAITTLLEYGVLVLSPTNLGAAMKYGALVTSSEQIPTEFLREMSFRIIQSHRSYKFTLDEITGIDSNILSISNVAFLNMPEKVLLAFDYLIQESYPCYEAKILKGFHQELYRAVSNEFGSEAFIEVNSYIEKNTELQNKAQYEELLHLQQTHSELAAKIHEVNERVIPQIIRKYDHENGPL